MENYMKKDVNQKSMAPDKILKMVTPEVAAKVVQKYVLPMFNQAKFNNSKGSIYRELKLSDNLTSHLNGIRLHLCRT